MRYRLLETIALLLPAVGACAQQPWDIGARAAEAVAGHSDHKVSISFEQRVRYESRTGNTFGKDPDLDPALLRTRFGLTVTPVKWFRISGMMQDSRAPLYGRNAPNSARDHADLHEGYIELFPDYKKGFGMTAGRRMMNFGEGRVIGTPQWGNLSRTYDHARFYWRSPKAQLELLMVSPVKVIIGQFNRPELGDRVIGTYNVFPNLYKKNSLDAYVLRHYQNRAGGFTGGSIALGTDKATVNAFGFRMTGPVAAGMNYSVEAILEHGKVGPADLSAAAWFASLKRRWNLVGRPLDFSVEYKYASGTENPADAAHSGTYDQLYAANHDKFGHEDLFGWRNLHNARSLTTFGITKGFAINFLYDSFWLANLKDGLYNSSGKVIFRSATGTAGRHVGQEADVFGTWKIGHLTFGAGYGHFFSGQFIRNTSPGVGPAYAYIFQSYSL